MRSVLFALYLRELKTRLGGQWWGFLWAVGEPLAGAAVMLAIYAAAKAPVLAGVDTVLFLVSGFLPFQLFKTLVLRGMDSIDANQGLLGYRQVRPVDTVLARAAVEVTLHLGITLAAWSLLGWLGHVVVPARPLELMAYSAALIAFGSACGLVAAVATAGALSRARAIVRLAFLPLTAASGVLFPLALLPQPLRELLLLNPLTHILEGLRSAFFGPSYAHADGLSPVGITAGVLAAVPVSLALYRLRRDHLQSA
jgi:capsular polysaccharide transport system permease protein